MSIYCYPVNGNKLPIDTDIDVVGIFVVLSIIIPLMILHFPVNPVVANGKKILPRDIN